MKKRLVFCVTNDLNHDQRMHRICSSLAEAGFDITLVGRKLPSSKSLINLPFKQHRLRCFINKGKLFYIEYQLRLLWFLIFRNADGIGAIDLDTIAACFVAAVLKRSKLIYDAHEYFPEVPEVIDRPFTKWIWQKTEAFFLPQCDLIYTVTESIAEVFRRKYHKEVAVIRNLPVLRQTDPVQFSDVIIYQGALNEGRGLEFLIEAMAKVDGKLLIAGEGDLSIPLRNQVTQLQLEGKVQFLGMLEPSALREFTNTAAIGINLLENRGRSYYFSLANKFMDYIHCGMPQISMNFPEYSRINEQWEVAILLNTCETEGIVTAIKELQNNRNRYLKLQENALLCRLQLNWQQESVKLVRLYERLFE
ncbi:MAG: glycosyltransferase [Chitinophagales bacterium]